MNVVRDKKALWDNRQGPAGLRLEENVQRRYDIRETPRGRLLQLHYYLQVLASFDFGCGERIAEYRMLWLKLSKLTQDKGSSMGFTCGIEVICSFVEQVLAVYGLLANLQEGFTINNVVFVLSAVIFSSFIFVSCNIAQYVTEEVGINTQQKLQQMYHNIPRHDTDSRREVRLFIKTIVENPPTVSFSGFVLVNRGLQTSMAMGHSRQAFDFDKYRHSRQATQVFFYALEHVPPTVRTIQQKWAYSSAWESKKDVPTFYGEIKPVMIILRILGVLPYSTTATGEVCFKWLSLAMFYSILCISAVTTLVGFNLAERINLSTKLENTFGNKTIEYALRLFISSVFTIPINHWPETGKKMRFINGWTELQAEYKATTGKDLRLGLQRKVSFSLLISLGLINAFVGLVYLRGVTLHWWNYIDFIFVISVTVLLPLIWVFTCAALTKVAKQLADDIEIHLSSRGLGKSSKIPSYTNLWLRLSKLTQDLGNCAGFTYGGQTLLYFAITILLTYGFMVELAEGFSYILFTAALLFLVIILSGCISAHGVSNE
ncbi:hypothetical protein Cfor_06772, partial [Coptotermes formosanus]